MPQDTAFQNRLQLSLYQEVCSFFAFLDLFIQFLARNTDNQSKEQSDSDIGCHFCQIHPVVIAMRTCDCLTQSIHTMCEWHIFIKILEYLWQYFYREGTTTSSNLDNHKHDCCCLADIAKGICQRVHKMVKVKLVKDAANQNISGWSHWIPT